MIEFKPVRLEDKQTIERYTMPSGIYNCDLAFANMYCWQAMYLSLIHISEPTRPY